MKILLVSLLALCSVSAFSMQQKDKNWDKMTFEEQKSMKLDMLNKKSAMIDETKTCVNNAKAKPDLEKCWKEMMDKKSAMDMHHHKDMHKQSMEAEKILK